MMNTGFRFDVFVACLIINIREFFRMVESLVRVKIIIGQFEVFIVKLRVFRKNIVDGCASITYKFFICDEFLDDGDDFLDFGVLDDSRTLPLFN